MSLFNRSQPNLIAPPSDPFRMEPTPASSNGRTPVSDTVNEGSTPSAGTILRVVMLTPVVEVTVRSEELQLSGRQFVHQSDMSVAEYDITLSATGEDKRAWLHALADGAKIRITIELLTKT